MRKPFVAPILAALAVAALAVPAGAAVPKTKPTRAAPCNGGDSAVHETGQASVWWDRGGLAAENPCSHWLIVGFRSLSEGYSGPATILYLAPRAHFAWPRKIGTRLNSPGDRPYNDPHEWGLPSEVAVDLRPKIIAGSNVACPDSVANAFLIYSYKHIVAPAVSGCSV